MPFSPLNNVIVAWASRPWSAARNPKQNHNFHGPNARATTSATSRALTRSRIALYSTIIPLLLAAVATGLLDHIQRVVLVVVGFSFIIFIHELGHFVVARLCSVRCDVFSIGIGPRMLGWKKGMGFSFGDGPKVLDTTVEAARDAGGIATLGDVQQEAQPAGVTFREKTNNMDAALKNLGTTDYRISWLPLGGYVRMLGQDDMDPTKISADPNAFNNRPIWQRMCIVSAGVIMNVILAAIIFMIVFSYGIDFPPAYVGGVVYGSPAAKAGLKAGDIITKIDGYAPAPGHGFLEFTDVLISSALWTGGDPVKYTIQRGNQPEFTVAIKPERGDTGLMSIGVEYGKSMKLPEFTPAEKADLKNMPNMAKFDSGDEIVAVDGESLASVPDNLKYPFVEERLQKSNGHPLTLTVKNTAGAERPITVTPQLSPRLGVDEIPNLLGLIPTVTINAVLPGQPADKAGLKEGDVIARINEREWPSVAQLQDIIHKNPGKEISLDVFRDGKISPIPPFKPGFKGDEGYIGIMFGPDYDRATIAGVDPSLTPTPLIVGGSQITAIDNQPVQSWKDVFVYLRDQSATAATQPASVQLTLKDPGTAGSTRTLSLALSATAREDVSKLTFIMGIQLRNLVKPQQAKTTYAAVQMGMDHTKTFILQTYATLYGLFNNTVPTNQLHGIIGIAKVGHDIQDRGLIWLLYVLGMVSVNLAVANFLPLPIVDGGLFLLLIVEKIRGKPLSLKVQSAIQIVGLCLLGAMFLFVTKNDIGMFFNR